MALLKSIKSKLVVFATMTTLIPWLALGLKSIKSKLVVFATIATLIPSLGLGLLTFRQSEAQINANVTRELRALTDYAGREIEFWLDKRAHEAHVAAASGAVIEALSASYQRRADMSAKYPGALARYLQSVQGKLDAIMELTVMNASGKIIASSAEKPAGATLPDEWPQNSVTEGLVIAPPHWNEQYSTATLSVAVPVLSYDNVLMGALVAVLDLRNLQPHLKSSSTSPPGEVFLLDPNGRVLIGTLPGETIVQLDASSLRDLLARPGESLFFEGLTRREVIGLADVSREFPLTILAERDRAAVYGDWIELRNMLLILVGTLVLIVAAAAFQMGRSIVVPLQRLMRAADRIADGDLEVRLSATRNDEIGHLTKVFDQMADRLRRNHAEIMAAHEAMQQQNRMLEKLSITDSLTGLYNRNKLDAILADQLARFRRTQRPFALLMLDIDHFKTLNDTYGHITGDKILAKVAQILLQSIRSIDYAARYGGDEFVIILVETYIDQVVKTAERIRAHVENLTYPAGKSMISITVSIGAVECRPDDSTTTAVFSRADNALYEAKRAGRNRAYFSR
ncbi:diguanylate cyclase (GGDEF) domain-containing protein [Nitrosospira multiformis]|uniref:diguanylate cyclase n=1 Tax=Nitrosospira multiformis TaxID=1231 RepID=A0A1H8J949_9PROT|nr:diguanylate cyclase [Nitrosospira multiformis]SEN77314.1 diguanylate cyclase (GGDEF) domain-containing protein [Nitrosospira multiformis]